MRPVDVDEAALWRRGADGDAEAFASVFDLHRDHVFRQALRLVDTWEEAEDVAAAAFLELWRRRRDVRVVGGSVLPRLLVTTANLARNSERARRRYRDFLVRLPRETRSPDAAEAVLNGTAALIATIGKAGYLCAKDLTAPEPANPSQALQWQNSPLVTIHLPVYEPDGKIQIGVFDVRRHAAMQLG